MRVRGEWPLRLCFKARTTGICIYDTTGQQSHIRKWYKQSDAVVTDGDNVVVLPQGEGALLGERRLAQGARLRQLCVDVNVGGGGKGKDE